MRILACGSRTFTDRSRIFEELLMYAREGGPHVLIQGEARGADSIARDIARQFGWEIESYPADWNRYGKRAGYVRNEQMLREGKPDIVIAFRSSGESRGTDMMISLANAAGVRTTVLTQK